MPDDVINRLFDSEQENKPEKARLKAFKLMWDYYEGNHKKPLKVKTGQSDDNILVNLCRPLIDDATAFLFGDPAIGEEFKMELEVEGQRGEDDIDETEEAVRLAWSNAGGHLYMQNVRTQGGVTGHWWIKILPAVEEDEFFFRAASS